MTHPLQFTIYQDALHQWRWRCTRASPKGLLIIADSSESYRTRFNATRAVHELLSTMRDGHYTLTGESAARPRRSAIPVGGPPGGATSLTGAVCGAAEPASAESKPAKQVPPDERGMLLQTA